MPQASDHLRDLMVSRFGSIETEGPEGFLKEHGWTLNADWTWSKEGVKNVGQMPRNEFDCLLFLVQEWDYGAIKE